MDKSKYKCDKCKDMLFILDNDEATPCSCRSIRIAEDLLKKSGISEAFKEKSFENFNYKVDYQILDAYTKAKTYAQDIIINFKQNKRALTKESSIIFMGQVGSGKTHLSMAIANSLLNKGISVIYMPFRDIITQVKQNMLDEEYYRKTIDRYKNARILLIDDLFKGNITKSDINIMFEIINYRYLNKLPMIISTECTKDMLLNIDEALGSRIIEMSKDHIIELRGKKLNYRIYS
ncbi:ATP-binding protein [Romboutsia sp. Marseille-P6047]|uniref:ATP-binding protein n=1 Tax=Romboutsia sp. Marseille-P6047 TaxID=2161817 RepID=UPI000F045A04|nr:ATP-binding protein [Romboutsia sp. Marseille-P6047]